MTPYERENPHVLNGSRKARIEKGSGRNIQEINRLIKQFEQMQKMMKTAQKGNFNPLQQMKRR
jgi:signal recognition particle subunit SRP54